MYGSESSTDVHGSVVSGDFALLIWWPGNDFTFPHSCFSFSHIFRDMKIWLKKKKTTEQKVKTFNRVLLWDLKTRGPFLKMEDGLTNKLEL